MDNTFLAQLTNGRVEEIETGGSAPFLLVRHGVCANCDDRSQTIRLNIGNNTMILDENGNRISINDLRTGMLVNAAYSPAATRSIPPQATAFIIQVVRRPADNNTTIGRIVDIDRQNRSFTTISGGNLSSVIRFNVADDAQIRNVFGRPINFSSLVPGLRVQVRHAAFMTASIPPQTTAFEIRVLA